MVAKNKGPLTTYVIQFNIIEPTTIKRVSLAHSCLLGSLVLVFEKWFNKKCEYKFILCEWNPNSYSRELFLEIIKYDK